MIRVEARLYATLREYCPGLAPGQSLFLEVAEGTTLSGLLEHLGIPAKEVKVVFVNNVQRGLSYALRPGDKLGVFPPIAGG